MIADHQPATGIQLTVPADGGVVADAQAVHSQHLGLDVTRTRRRLVAFSALLVGAAVAFAGSISFVGLVVEPAQLRHRRREGREACRALRIGLTLR